MLPRFFAAIERSSPVVLMLPYFRSPGASAGAVTLFSPMETLCRSSSVILIGSLSLLGTFPLARSIGLVGRIRFGRVRCRRWRLGCWCLLRARWPGFGELEQRLPGFGIDWNRYHY